MKNLYSMEYHDRQFRKIYRSTEVFIDWLDENCFNGNILDAGCGLGANTYYMAKKFPNANFYGVEYASELCDIFNSKYKTDNCSLIHGDVYNLGQYLPSLRGGGKRLMV